MSHILEVIIKAQDQASSATKKVSETIKKMGTNSKSAGQIASTASKQISSAFRSASSEIGSAFNRMKTNMKIISISSQSTTSKIKSYFKVAGQFIGTSFNSAVTGVKTTIKSLSTVGTEIGTKLKISFDKAKISIQGLKNKISEAIIKMKEMKNSTNQVGKGMGFLKSALSMTVGMLGYDLVNSIMETTRASLNARSSIQAFGSRLNMSGPEIQKFQSSLDNLQSTYKKIDMDVVGKQATDMAYRLGLPNTALTELTETTAIFTDAMQRNGRSAEDSMLAMSDAMDGQFVRLKEIGIGQEDLMRNGWSGDINDKTSLLHAMNEALKEQHYDTLAMSVDNLDDAWKVLSISGSNLLESILVPLTPVIIQVVDGVTKFIDSLKNMPDEGKIILMGAALAVIGYVLATSVIPAITATATALLTEMLPAFLAIDIAGAPLWAIVLAITAIALAVYEVGKYLGWWTDLSTMIDSIKAGVMRLWSAFTNNEDVQKVIKALGDAFNWVGQQVQPLIDWIVGLVSPTQEAGEQFDIVRFIIDLLGLGFHLLVEYLTNLYNSFMFIIGCVQNTISFFQWLYDCIMNIPTAAQDMITGIIDWFSQLPGLVWAWIVSAATKIVGGMTAWVKNGKAKAQIFVNAIIGFIKTLPSKVWNYLKQVVSKIINAGAQWASNALSAGKKIVTGVLNGLGNIADAVFGKFNGIKDAISRASTGAITAAKNFGQRALSAFKKAINSASPSDFYKIPANDFANIAGAIKNAQPGAVRAVGKFGKAMMNAYNTPDTNFSLGNDLTRNSNLSVDHTVIVEHDFSNLPGGVSAEEVARIVNRTAGTKEFANNLASSLDFQTVDLKMKSRLSNKQGRARGV